MPMRSPGLILTTILFAACSSSSTTNDGGNVGGSGGSQLDSGVAGDSGAAQDVASGGDATASEGGVSEAGASDGASGDAGPAPTFTQVYALIMNRCSPCHTTAAGIGVSMGHLDMTTMATAYTNLVNTAAAGVACAGKGTRVTPGMPDMSVMYLKVSLDDPTPCGAKMPFGLPALPKAETDTIENWIMAGAKND
jgi:hypothetical protein